MAHFKFFSMTFLLLCLTLPARAFSPQDIPDPLKPWVNWVLTEHNEQHCPFFYQDFQQKHCSWPGTLQLRLTEHKGHFNGEWTLYREDWLILPGDQQHWPQQVVSNRQIATVVEHFGKPAIWLPAGHYQVEGEFWWDRLPENLAIAEETGLINLEINGQPVASPRLEQGALWLSQQAHGEGANEQNSLDLQVFRKVIDDIPLQIETRLELQVSGKTRETWLPLALLPGFIPVNLDSPLPARLEADGRLHLQLRAGRWSISLLARHPQSLPQIDLPAHSSNDWPQSELWVFQAMPTLRLVEIEKLPSIDGSQTNLPAEWHPLPAYSIQAGQSMLFKTLRRGDPEAEPNQLSLHRKLWLDFDGGGYTVSDNITGKMTRDWRLTAMTETRLGQVLANGQNQLITQLADLSQGVETRRGALQIQADSRIESDINHLNAVGWRESFRLARTELNIPPGWRLLAVTGVDNVPQSWLTQWTLLDLFLVLIAALSMARLQSWHWGCLALVSLALIWHEADAPRWIWLHLLAAIALLRALPDGRLKLWIGWYRSLCLLILTGLLVPFLIQQFRIGFYPQLEHPTQNIATEAEAYSINDSNVAPPAVMSLAAPPAELAEAVPDRADKARKRQAASPSYAGSASYFDRVDPEANLQTGPGLPQWQWQRVELSWNGTVDHQQSIRLWYLPPSLSLVLHIIQALLAALLGLKLLGGLDLNGRSLLRGLVVVILLPALAFHGSDAYADIPDQQLLGQLRDKLLQPPNCLPSCAQLANLKASLTKDGLQLELQLHALQTVAVPLPTQFQQWQPQQVSVDGETAQGLLRQNEALWLTLPAGVHQILLRGRPAGQDRFVLPLPMAPQHAEITADGWRVEGLYENGKTGPQLEFIRVDRSQSTSQTLQPLELPAFIQVERTLHLGLDWRMTTRVSQLAGTATPVVLELPLLATEAITSPEIKVKDGKVLVNMSASQASVEWQSLLDKNEELVLTANTNALWTEVWRADISPIWHLQSEGIAPVHHQDARGSWLPEWRPWPGETVRLKISRPTAVPGGTLTIDKSSLTMTPGQRVTQATLNLQLRSSKGGQHTIRLPADAELQNVTIDGAPQAIRQQGRAVTLPIHPGSQQIALNWQSPGQQTIITHTPVVDLGVSSVNSHLKIMLAKDRWTLLTLGPAFGPAALIWGLLIVLALLATGLGRSDWTPLKPWQWFLLLVGLSQVHIAAGMVIVVWLMALGLRSRRCPSQRLWFNLSQAGLGALSLLSLLLLFFAIKQGLLGTPDMQISGNQSTAWNLNWYQDLSEAQLPSATVIAFPLFAYRLLMLAWSLWMALSLLNWLRWGWKSVSTHGLWKKRESATDLAQDSQPPG